MNIRVVSFVLLFIGLALCDYDPPRQIHLALTGNPTEMVFQWMTSLPTEESIVVVSHSNHSFSGTQKTYLPSAGYIHTVKVTGLTPSAKYEYYLGSSSSGWSSTFMFSTAPPQGDRLTRNYILYGDMGIFQYSYYTVEHVTAMVHSDPIEFIYQHGDYGYGNDRDAMFYELSWDLFFDQMTLAMNRVPYMAAPGNHEENCGSSICDVYANNFTVYNNRFRMPYEESGATSNMWFSFNYANVHFVSISTETDFPNCPYPDDTFGDQITWLKNDLQQANANEDVDWIIVTGHQPIYCSVSSKSTVFGVPKGDTRNVQQAFEEIFHDYKVDLYIDGHVHGYERTYPTYRSRVVGNYSQDEYVNPEATVYIVNGSAGNIEGFYDDWHDIIPSWSAKRYWPNPEHGFGVLSVSGSSFLEWTWYRNGITENSTEPQVFDTFSISRQ